MTWYSKEAQQSARPGLPTQRSSSATLQTLSCRCHCKVFTTPSLAAQLAEKVPLAAQSKPLPRIGGWKQRLCSCISLVCSPAGGIAGGHKRECQQILAESETCARTRVQSSIERHCESRVSGSTASSMSSGQALLCAEMHASVSFMSMVEDGFCVASRVDQCRRASTDSKSRLTT